MSHCFVTVGSTHFDELVEASLSPSTLDALRRKGFTDLVVQCGKFSKTHTFQAQSAADGPWEWEGLSMRITAFRYKPSLQEEYEKADLVISHAGE